jgi:hypothetical protein
MDNWSEVPCREWQGYRDNCGYGSTSRKRGDGKWGGRTAHSVAWESVNGPVLEGMEVCHRCDNRACIEIRHLYLGTHRQNMADMAAKGRAVHGAAHPKTVLQPDDVEKIRERLKAGESQRSIARSYGVTLRPIGQIARGETHRGAGG